MTFIQCLPCLRRCLNPCAGVRLRLIADPIIERRGSGRNSVYVRSIGEIEKGSFLVTSLHVCRARRQSDKLWSIAAPTQRCIWRLVSPCLILTMVCRLTTRIRCTAFLAIFVVRYVPRHLTFPDAQRDINSDSKTVKPHSCSLTCPRDDLKRVSIGCCNRTVSPSRYDCYESKGCPRRVLQYYFSTKEQRTVQVEQ